MLSSQDVAVLLIVFNRPSTTLQVVEALRMAKIRKLYVAANAPRPNIVGDIEKTAEVHKIVASLAPGCAITWLRRREHLPCRISISTAINWFFENVPEGIVLEDDCVPGASFFPYCAELLERFRDDPRIALISGSTFIPSPVPESYWFSKYADIWGWASWRRAWNMADMTMQAWPSWRDSRCLERLPGISPGFVNYWTRMFDRTYSGEMATSWDFVWMFDCWRHGLLSVRPATSLIRNVGFGVEATNTPFFDQVNPHVAQQIVPMTFPLRHNENVVVDDKAERLYTRLRYSVDILAELAALAERGGPLGRFTATAAKGLRNWVSVKYKAAKPNL